MEVWGESGLFSDVFKNSGFLERVGIGDREISSRALNFIIDWGKDVVSGDAVPWIRGGGCVE